MQVELSKKEIDILLKIITEYDFEYPPIPKERRELKKKLKLLLLEPCPVCHGTGSILNPDSQVYIPCKICKGKGI
jgi:RecJ-like exonuclease